VRNFPQKYIYLHEKKIMQLPEAFISRTKPLLGDEWADFEQALTEEIPTSIRFNPEKAGELQVKSVITDAEIPVPWATNGFYLSSRPVFTLDPLFHAGCYYVQEASSMFLEYFVRKYIHKPVKVLDLCAAPGGKSTHLLSVLPEKSVLVANEVIRSRAGVLSENIVKWGNPDAMIINNDPSEIGKSGVLFDVIVADAPCSGEGMFRKDPAAVSEWSVGNVRLCAERQRRIIADIWPALRPGGLLIYSTCTYNREENEENIDWICRELGAEKLEEPHRFMPHKTKGEGFFIAALKRHDTKGEAVHSPSGRHKPYNMPNVRNDAVLSWLSSPADFILLSENNRFFAVPAIHYGTYLSLKQHLKIVSAGIALGELKGKDLIPDHALAMSNALSEQAFPVWELDRRAALRYLRKEALQDIPPELPKGYVLVRYMGCSLGFIKNIGTRANNLYPQEWRIRMNIPLL
jgi:16S rRNA C967 or C1407 C5-methylase (RsmB/RsmF family)/NOL1/NOP2/fmu family ribosome biogenesis protein